MELIYIAARHVLAAERLEIAEEQDRRDFALEIYAQMHVRETAAWQRIGPGATTVTYGY